MIRFPGTIIACLVIGATCLSFAAFGSQDNELLAEPKDWNLDCSDEAALRIQTPLGFSVLAPRGFNIINEDEADRLVKEVPILSDTGREVMKRIVEIWTETVSTEEITRGQLLAVPDGYPSAQNLSIYAFRYPGRYSDNLYVFAVVKESEALFVMSTWEIDPIELTSCIRGE